jgi:four helix bundle protein
MQKEIIENNPLLRLTLAFSLQVIEYCELLDQHKKYVISKQLLRAATSIGANSFEAQNAESKADFVHKIKLAAKESDETQYWLMLCEFAKSYPDCNQLTQKLEEINRILNSIMSTSRKNNS